MKKTIFFLTFLLLLFVSCVDTMPLTVSKIKTAPDTWHRCSIYVVGEIRNPNKIPFTNAGIYSLDDKSGSIVCFTRGRGMPRAGDELVIEGTLFVTVNSLEELAAELDLSLPDVKMLVSFLKKVFRNTSFDVILVEEKRRAANFVDRIIRDIIQVFN